MLKLNQRIQNRHRHLCTYICAYVRKYVRFRIRWGYLEPLVPSCANKNKTRKRNFI